MSEAHILGHCNATLAILVDTLGVSGKALSHINVVCNVPVADETPWKPHHSFEISVQELQIEEWDGKFQNLIMGVYKPESKRIVFQAFSRSHGIQYSDYSCLFHPAATASPQTDFGYGVFLAPGTIISPFASIGDLVTVNRNTSIGHHTKIGAFTSINPGCNIAGKCEIGENVSIGIGAVILDGLTIGHNAIIGAGSIVNRSIPDDAVAWGTPAKVIKHRSELQ
jgi:sugar O-acyltransferase (sialic acid O-acetyltransferase NeuD family)